MGLYFAEGIHVFLGILWVGGVLFVDLVAFPLLLRLPPERQSQAGQMLMLAADRFFVPIGALVIVSGMLRGTLFGPIKSTAFLLSTTYGRAWLMALLVAIATLLWGTFGVFRPTMRFFTAPSLWGANHGSAWAQRKRALRGLMLREAGEVVGFLIILGAMMIMGS